MVVTMVSQMAVLSESWMVGQSVMMTVDLMAWSMAAWTVVQMVALLVEGRVDWLGLMRVELMAKNSAA